MDSKSEFWSKSGAAYSAETPSEFFVIEKRRSPGRNKSRWVAIGIDKRTLRQTRYSDDAATPEDAKAAVRASRGLGGTGLSGNCRDAAGNFIPVPACMGRHVPKGAGRGKKQCKYGVNKRTGKCLKHPRRK
jgi:hypothetical protein